MTRRPVKLLYSQWLERITDAIESERRLKKWSRAKKEALIRGDLDALQALSARRTAFGGEDLRPQRDPKAIR
ncbi:hypothetical protein [Bradyrhizobium sp. SZCCHNR1051]|uniref:GIY-YIG nuclease family protein n=1 Tax=Bradyrhizobium sp. SZCCHNR1051 TaxID=3057355 RepID=UPI002915DFE7|nr:hypothetical protein [Bradyrhizobium sp. SZCCHNR1051]